MGKKHSLIKSNERKIEHSIRVTVCAMVCVFVLLAVLGNLFAPHSSAANFVVVVVLTVAMLWFVSNFCEKTVNAYKSWFTFIFLFAFALRFVIISTWSVEPTSDFKSVHNVAIALANADTVEIKTIMKDGFSYYYSMWPVHMPFILLQTVIVKLFGPGYYPMQIFLNIFASLSCVIAAIIAKNLYGRRAGIITGIIMAFLPSNLMYSTLLSNQHMATFFFLLAIYILIEKPIKRRLVNVALASICVVVSQLIRPEMPVFIIAVICYFIYKYILGMRRKKKQKAMRKKVAGYAVMFLSIYISLMFVASLLIGAGGYVEKNIKYDNYKYKIAVGLNAESEGRWNEADAQFANDEVMLDKLIKERTQNKGQVASLMAKKIMHQYGTYNYDWCIEGKTGNFAQKWYEPITNGVMLVVLLLCMFKIIMSIYNKSRREVLLLIAMLGYFLVYTVIEVQNRYNYSMIPLFVILASGAVVHLYEYAQMHIEKIKNKKENA